MPGWAVVSAAVAPPPNHKQNPGTAREQAQRAKRQAHHQRRHKRGRQTTAPSTAAQRYAQTWVLFTEAPTIAQAVAEDAGRMAIEATFRDWHHHWAVRAAVVALSTAAIVERWIGVICLAYSLQLPLGQRGSQDAAGRRRRAQWTVSDRESGCWCGQQVLSDVGYDWRAWLARPSRWVAPWP